MTRRPTIYGDMDDVLGETARRFLIVIEREFGKKASYEQLTDFDFERSCGLTAAERKRLYELVHYDAELLAIEPIPQAIGVLQCWQQKGVAIAIVTGRPPDSMEVSLQWLARYRVPFDSFTVVNKYGRFKTENSIGLTLAELAERHYDWAVEDSLPMAQFITERMQIPVALLDRPWNREPEQNSLITRCGDWGAVAAAIHID